MVNCAVQEVNVRMNHIQVINQNTFKNPYRYQNYKNLNDNKANAREKLDIKTRYGSLSRVEKKGPRTTKKSATLVLCLYYWFNGYHYNRSNGNPIKLCTFRHFSTK